MQKDLGNGLVLRSLSEGIESDKNGIIDFYKEVFKDAGDEDYEEVGTLAEDLISGQHPNMSLDDVWVVVDTTKDDLIVSALLLIPQTWHYDHIELGVGRVEIVATHTDYRRRGLVRELMNVAHQRSDDLGHIVQGITGIGHYYRRFGYAMAVNLGTGSHMPFTAIPKLGDDAKPDFTLRPATTDDIDNILAWQAYEQRDGGLTLDRNRDNWHFDINTRQEDSPVSMRPHIIQSAGGDDVGFVTFIPNKYYGNVDVWHYVVGERSSIYATFNDVLRGIQSFTDDFYADLPDDKYPTRLRFDSGIHSSVHQLVVSTGGVKPKRIYAWYIRVADLPRFIKHIAPVLEQRLAGSGMNRFTGDLKIGFYQRDGLKITFEDGKITNVEMTPIEQYDGDAGFPYDTFLNMLFGHRGWRELVHVLPEIFARAKAQLLLDILFPPMRAQLGDGLA